MDFLKRSCEHAVPVVNDYLLNHSKIPIFTHKEVKKVKTEKGFCCEDLEI
jgi:hypothetical protein